MLFVKKLLYPRWTDFLIIYQNMNLGKFRKFYRAIISIAAPLRASASHWDDIAVNTAHQIRFFWDIPAVTEYRNKQITGNINETRISYVNNIYFKTLNNKNLEALSIGSGQAYAEIEYAKLGIFKKIVCSDISNYSLKKAKQNARINGVEEIFDFRVSSAADIINSYEKYDIIFCFNSLHHIPDVGAYLAKLSGILNHEGLIIIDDSIGPRHHRYPKRKIKLMQAILESIPEDYRIDIKNGRIKKRILIPSPLMIYLLDPSEMIASDEIMPAIKENYNVLQYTPYAGSLLTHVITNIAHNFIKNSGNELLLNLLEIESFFMKSGLDDPDNAFIVAKKLSTNHLISSQS